MGWGRQESKSRQMPHSAVDAELIYVFCGLGPQTGHSWLVKLRSGIQITAEAAFCCIWWYWFVINGDTLYYSNTVC